MALAETLQPEAGDDRYKDAEIAKLEEMYDAPTIAEPRAEIKPGPGDVILKHVDLCGRLVMQRAHIRIR